jgi:hypothetical protein
VKRRTWKRRRRRNQNRNMIEGNEKNNLIKRKEHGKKKGYRVSFSTLHSI